MNDKNVTLNFFEASDHPLNSSTKKHKIQLLFYSFVLWLCFFSSEHKVSMILGVKFEEPISPVSIMPLVMILIIYHLIMFTIHLRDSLNNWELKILTNENIELSKNKDNKVKNQYCFNVLESELPKINTNELNEKNQELKSFVDKLKKIKKTFSEHDIYKNLNIKKLGETQTLHSEFSDFKSFYKKLSEAYESLAKGKNINMNDLRLELNQINEFLENYKSSNFDVVLMTRELYHYMINHDQLSVEMVSTLENTIKLANENEDLYYRNMEHLIHLLSLRKFNHDELRFKLPFIYFPIFFSSSTLFPMYFLIFKA